MNKKLIIWGTSGHAKVVADAAMLQGIYEIEGYLDDVNPERHGKEFFGSKVLGGRDLLAGFTDRGGIDVVLGFGDCQGRLKLSLLVSEIGLALATIVHPRAVVATQSTIGPGSVILAATVVNTDTTIGRSVILNTGSTIDHECVIGDGVHICPGVHIAGRVRVGRGTWVGIGTTVIDGVNIGDGSYIGAGSLVLEDIPPGVVAYGVPAKIVRRV